MKRKASKVTTTKAKRRLAIEMDEALITRGKVRALREGRSLTKLLNELLTDYLDRVGEPEVKQ
jgi:CRISPR/Cas system Type II protein with McrA/HNH and RuvC-like nuclease domain